MSYKYGINKRQIEGEEPSFPSPTPTDSDPGVSQTLAVLTPEIPATVTVTEPNPNIVTTTVAVDASSTSSSSSNILVAALLGTIGLIIILSGLLFIVFCLRKGENKGTIRNLTRVNDGELIESSNNSINDEMVTYRPSNPDDEQLPSYAEAIVRGRNSNIINQ